MVVAGSLSLTMLLGATAAYVFARYEFPGRQVAYYLFVGGMRQGEVPRSGHLERFDFNEKWEELHREGMLRDLQQRIRDVRQGPDGNLYLLTAENDGALMRIEPGK